ncbi:hypothetical protein RJ641_017070 [Dillenia turbinata]|uniref:Plasma membrane ATPase n=1 Tax=Dillenia turbinata TaxID=194707 RepID=A0AAN8Z2U2_9MAGN
MVEKSIGLDDVINKNVDLENIPLEEAFQYLECTKEGLSSDDNKGWDLPDFFGIILLLIINSTVSFIEENNAGNAAAALMARLAPKAKVLRDGKWREEDAAVLVPGDIISIKLGDIIPADALMHNLQSAITGESLPVTKNPGDGVYSGSTCKQGEIEAVVTATGVHTFFGKAAHLVDNTTHVGHFQKLFLVDSGFNFNWKLLHLLHSCWDDYRDHCDIWAQERGYRAGIDNLLVSLVGGIPIAMPTVLSVTMVIGSHRLSQQGAITKRMTAIEEMAGMDVLCSDKTGTLTLNKLTVDKNLIEVFTRGVDKDMVVLMAARASRLENQDAIDGAIVAMLSDPKEARAGIQEVHFLPFNPTDKRTALTYIDKAGKMHRVSKGAPEQILNLAHNKSGIKQRVHTIIDKFAERGLRSLGVAYQEVPAGNKDSPGGPWEFVGLLPLFDPPCHDSANTIMQALDLGVSVKMITGDQLAIAKETGRRLGMGTNMYPSSTLLSESKDVADTGLPIDDLIEQADGFAGVFPGEYEIVRRLQDRKHICGMTGDGVNDAPALKKADIGIAVADSTDSARSASDIVLTEPGLGVIISAVLTSRAIFQRMKNYTVLLLSADICRVYHHTYCPRFYVAAVFWKFDFPPFMVLVIAILNDGTIMTISKDKVKPSPVPDSWKLSEIFATGVVLGGYLALMSVIFFWLAYETNFFKHIFNVKSFNQHDYDMKNEATRKELHGKLASAIYLQVSTISQALIFVTRSRSWSYTERPGQLLVAAFIIAQLIATVISATANWGFAEIRSIGWHWTGVIWLYNIVTYIPLDPLKFAVRYALSGRAWGLMMNQRVRCFTDALVYVLTAFTNKKDFGKGAREAAWASAQRTLHGLQSNETKMFPEKSSFGDMGTMAEEAKRRAEITRFRGLHTLKGKVESFAKLRGLDIDAMNQHYTV